MTLSRRTGLGWGGRGGFGLLWGDFETETDVVSGLEIAAAACSLRLVRVPGRNGPPGTDVDLLSGCGLALLGRSLVSSSCAELDGGEDLMLRLGAGMGRLVGGEDVSVSVGCALFCVGKDEMGSFRGGDPAWVCMCVGVHMWVCMCVCVGVHVCVCMCAQYGKRVAIKIGTRIWHQFKPPICSSSYISY